MDRYIFNKTPNTDGIYTAIQTWSKDKLPEGYAWFPKELMDKFYLSGKKIAGCVIPVFDEAEENVVDLSWNDEAYNAWLEKQPKWYEIEVNRKISELSKASNKAIESGVDVDLTPSGIANVPETGTDTGPSENSSEATESGEEASEDDSEFTDSSTQSEVTPIIEHFDLTSNDQANLSNMFNAIVLGATSYPYHCKDGNCRIYNKEEIVKIYIAVMLYITSHQTRFNQLKQLCNSYIGKGDEYESELRAINYDTTELTGEYLANYNVMLQSAQEQITSVLSKLTSTLGL